MGYGAVLVVVAVLVLVGAAVVGAWGLVHEVRGDGYGRPPSPPGDGELGGWPTGPYASHRLR